MPVLYEVQPLQGPHVLLRARRSEAGKEMNVDVIVMGATTLDIMMGDRFVHAGLLYEIIWVSIEQDAFISAEATIHG